METGILDFELSGRFFFPFRFLDAKLFQPVLQSSKSQTEQLRRLGDVVVSLFHRLHDEIALDVFETDAFRRQLERAFGDGTRLLSNFKRQIVNRYLIAFAQQDGALDGRFELANIPWPTVIDSSACEFPRVSPRTRREVLRVCFLTK